MLKLYTTLPVLWEDASLVSNTTFSLFNEFFKFEIPLNPLLHPINEFVVIPVYVIISLFILSNPYFAGHPAVDSTGIVSSSAPISAVRVDCESIFVFEYESKSLYSSRFDIRSTEAPLNSWEI